MKVYVCAIFDDKAKAFLPPFCMQQIGMATRAFASAVNDVDHQFHKHAADFTLFGLGMFDDSTGMLEPSQAPQAIVNGLMLKNSSDVGSSVVRVNGSVGNQEDSVHA